MALKATVYKAHLQIADMDRSVYADHSITLARHPSETDERMMVRLLAFVLHVPADDQAGQLEFAKDLWDADEPALWHKDYTQALRHWIEVGQPDDRRLLKACGRSQQVTVLSFTSSTALWWQALAPKLERVTNLSVWQIASAQSQALARVAQRNMKLQVTLQDGTLWLSTDTQTIEVTPERLTKG